LLSGHGKHLMDDVTHLSKSRFTSGLQCHKQLWWRVHEPNAPELISDTALLAVFDQGNRVGELARSYVPGGRLVDLPHGAFRERAALTRELLDQNVPVIYEASFFVDGLYASVDILKREGGSFRLIEVKASTKVKKEHRPDVAFQRHVVRRSGLDVAGVAVMHLNTTCSFPHFDDLFTTKDITSEVEALQAEFPALIASQLRMLEGDLPEVKIGKHCKKPHECPFMARCWEEAPEPPTGVLVIKPGLAEALSAFQEPLAFLDFETVSLAIPIWNGCHPYDQVPVQFSCHRPLPDGTVVHHEWLAEGPEDPRPEVARRLVEACRGAKTVVAYFMGFERKCLKLLAAAVPELAEELQAIAARLADPLPVVRNHAAHPAFGGSFSLKVVLPVLVPGTGYSGLEIAEGGAASRELERLMFQGAIMPADERERLRENLLRYCAVDTSGLMQLLDRLRELA